MSSSSDRLIRCTQPLIPDGAPVRQAFMCQTAPSVWMFIVNYLTYLTIFWIRYRIVCVTDDAIYVFRGTKFRIDPREMIATLSRDTRLGPVSGRWAQIRLLGERHWVHKRFHAEITAADAALAG